MNQLFLEQAARYRASQGDGRPRLVSPPGLWAICTGLVAAMAAALFFVATGEYARKATVAGVLETQIAVKRVHVPRSGIVREILVSPGELVTAGTTLIRLAAASGVDAGEKAQALAGYDEQLAAIAVQLAQLKIMQESELAGIDSEAAALKQKTYRHKTVTQLQQEKVDELQRTQAAARPLFDDGRLSRIEWGRFLDATLSARQQLAGLLAEATAQEQRLAQLGFDAAQSVSRYNRQIAVLDQQSTDLRQRRHQLLADEQFSVEAPIDGYVSSLLVQAGQQVGSSQSVVTVLPRGTRLYAKLQIPSRAAGFVKPGQPVNLLYDAFPYQQFGSYQATLTEISEHAMLPQEEHGIRSTAPFFLAKADLSQQFVLAYGDEVPLKSGMLLTADIVLEKRSLMAWLLEPLLVMKGRAG